MVACKHCNKDVPQKEGRRARLYCDDKCKRLFHKKPKETITITMDKYLWMLGKLKLTSGQLLKLNTKPMQIATAEEWNKAIEPYVKKGKKSIEIKMPVKPTYDNGLPKVKIDKVEKLPGESAIDYAIRKEEKKPVNSLTSLLP